MLEGTPTLTPPEVTSHHEGFVRRTAGAVLHGAAVVVEQILSPNAPYVKDAAVAVEHAEVRRQGDKVNGHNVDVTPWVSIDHRT